jgi:thioredoxin
MLSLIANCSSAQSTSGGEVIKLNKADFLVKVFNYEKQNEEWVYEGKKPCVIDFYADWCGPCKMIAPIMKELASTYKDEVIFYQIDVDVERELAVIFGASSIPMILFIPVKGTPQAAVGALPKATMEEQIKLMLGKKS